MNFKDKLNGILKKKGFIPLTLKYFAGLVVTSILIVGTNIAFFFEPEINSFLVQPIIDNTELSQAAVQGQKMSARIIEEGVTLLKMKIIHFH